MKAYGQSRTIAGLTDGQDPPEQLQIAVTFKGGLLGPTKMAARLSAASVSDFAPLPGEVEQAIEALKRRGFVVSGRGRMTLSVRASREQFEETFGTRLSMMKMPDDQDYSRASVFYPGAGAPWNPDAELAKLIDDAYIQWPHIYMAGRAAAGTKPPIATPAAAKSAAAPVVKAAVKPATHATAVSAVAAVTTKKPSAKPPKRAAPVLDVLKDLRRLLNASPAHHKGHRGEGVRVAMIDTGFAHSHPFFVSNGFASSVVLAPGATHRDTDPGSHGTGESANVFALAPNATFIGIKLGDDDNPKGGASLLEGFQEALRHDPHVISCSVGYDLRATDGRSPATQLPNGLKALEVEIQAAVGRGVVVVFSAGNGHYSFPGQMPEVISAGGTYFDAQGRMVASNYASAFTSLIYSGRTVPDVCGLVGPLPHADYIMLPIPPGSDLDRESAAFDGTRADDGWAAFSGTSAAAPQIAGVCALLKQKNPALSPAAMLAVLQRTARDVLFGSANPASDPSGHGLPAGPSHDGATGYGLVDAGAAWKQV